MQDKSVQQFTSIDKNIGKKSFLKVICFTIRCHLSVGTLPISNLLHCDSTNQTAIVILHCLHNRVQRWQKTLHQLITVPQQSVGQNIIIIGAVTSRRRDEWTTASPSVLSFLSSPLFAVLTLPTFPDCPEARSCLCRSWSRPHLAPSRFAIISPLNIWRPFFWSDGHLVKPTSSAARTAELWA